MSHDQQIPSLREVVLVDHAGRLIEVSRRVGGSFVHGSHRGNEPLALTAVNVELTLDGVYAGTD